MGKIDPRDADRYQTNSGSEWFRLVNDGDVATVQFMLDKYEDLDVFACHKVEIIVGGEKKERYVDCLRSYEDPIDACPFCAAGFPVKPVRFVVMYDHADGKVKIWERGPQFIKILQGYIDRYQPLSSYVFEIERNGAVRSKDTRYNVYPMDRVEAYDLSDVERPTFLGGLILEKSAEDMEVFLSEGSFPSDAEDAAVEQAPIRRRASVAPSRGSPRSDTVRRADRSVVASPSQQSSDGVQASPPLRGPSRSGRNRPEVF